MGLLNATIANAPTITVTGGTAVTLSSDGQYVQNGVHLIDASVTDYRTRPNLAVRVKQPTFNRSTGTWSKSSKYISITIPKILADGTQEFPVMKLELRDHPEMTIAEVLKLREWAIQCLQDADFVAFWNTGSLG